MWSISVDPIPSRIASWQRSRQRCHTSAGSGSAAETQRRTDARTFSDEAAARGLEDGAVGEVAALSSALYIVGVEKNNVGRSRCNVANTLSGVGRPAWSTVVAPTEYGNDRLLPSP